MYELQIRGSLIRLGSVLLKQYGDFATKQTNTGITRSACEIACL